MKFYDIKKRLRTSNRVKLKIRLEKNKNLE